MVAGLKAVFAVPVLAASRTPFPDGGGAAKNGTVSREPDKGFELRSRGSKFDGSATIDPTVHVRSESIAPAPK